MACLLLGPLVERCFPNVGTSSHTLDREPGAVETSALAEASLMARSTREYRTHAAALFGRWFESGREYCSARWFRSQSHLTSYIHHTRPSSFPALCVQIQFRLLQ